MTDHDHSPEDELDIPLYADYEIERIAFGLQLISERFEIGAPTLCKSINRFAENTGLLNTRDYLNTKNVQRGLAGSRQKDDTLRILDRYVAAMRPLRAADRLGEAIGEFLVAKNGASREQSVLKGPASHFTREFVGSYRCYYKRWLSPKEADAAHADPAYFVDQNGLVRIAGESRPRPDYVPFEFAGNSVQFRPTAGHASIEMSEVSSPYINYAKSHGLKPKPMVWNGTLAQTGIDGQYFGILKGESDALKTYHLKRGGIDQATGFHELRGMTLTASGAEPVRLVPMPGQGALGDYFPDELMSEAKKEWLYFTRDSGDENR